MGLTAWHRHGVLAPLLAAAATLGLLGVGASWLWQAHETDQRRVRASTARAAPVPPAPQGAAAPLQDPKIEEVVDLLRRLAARAGLQAPLAAVSSVPQEGSAPDEVRPAAAASYRIDVQGRYPAFKQWIADVMREDPRLFVARVDVQSLAPSPGPASGPIATLQAQVIWRWANP